MEIRQNENIIRTKSFLERVILEELDKLMASGVSYMGFVIMGQVIEVLGSFLDSKPMKAKGQSFFRFSKAVDCLFGGRYRVLNRKGWLYDKLRNQMVHTFIPSEDLLIFKDGKAAGGYVHLEEADGKIVLIADSFRKDIERACARLLQLLEEGKLKPKNIGFGYE